MEYKTETKRIHINSIEAFLFNSVMTNCYDFEIVGSNRLEGRIYYGLQRDNFLIVLLLTIKQC